MNPNFLRFMIGDLLAQKSFKEDTESQWLTGMRTVWQNWSTLKKLRQETRT